MPYAGPLEVEDDTFTINVETLIIRDNEIAFVFSGTEEDGAFSIEGIAKLTEHGFYIAPRLLVNYKIYSGEYRASIKINSVQESPGKRNCHVVGLWIEDGVDWEFKGKLQIKPV